MSNKIARTITFFYTLLVHLLVFLVSSAVQAPAGLLLIELGDTLTKGFALEHIIGERKQMFPVSCKLIA